LRIPAKHYEDTAKRTSGEGKDSQSKNCYKPALVGRSTIIENKWLSKTIIGIHFLVKSSIHCQTLVRIETDYKEEMCIKKIYDDRKTTNVIAVIINRIPEKTIDQPILWRRQKTAKQTFFSF